MHVPKSLSLKHWTHDTHYTNSNQNNNDHYKKNAEYIHHTQYGKSQCLHIGMPMGYGTIASNGAAHGSKAQTIYNYKPKIYT